MSASTTGGSIIKVHQSSHLLKSEYNPNTAVLRVQFSNGAVYEHHGVPMTEYNNFEQADSPGRYYHSKIKPNYSPRQIGAGITKTGKASQRRY